MSDLTPIMPNRYRNTRMSLNNDTGLYQVEVDCQEGDPDAGTILQTDLTEEEALRWFFGIATSKSNVGPQANGTTQQGLDIMHQKSFTLKGQYRIVDNAVEEFEPDYDPETGYELTSGCWRPTPYKVGNEGTLRHTIIESESSTYSELWDICFNTQGIPGNLRPILMLHGWRGTTANRSIYAHGRRRIKAIRQLKNGDISITVGPDLAPDQP